MKIENKTNIFLVVYSVFILATPIPYTETYTLVVNWIGFILSVIPVYSFRTYLKTLPPNQNTLLHSLLIMLMYALCLIGALTAGFPTVLQAFPNLKSVDYIVYSVMYTQSEIFASLLMGVTTQCITVALIILSFFPVKYLSFNTKIIKGRIQIGIVLFCIISTFIINLSCWSVCSAEMYIFGSIVNGMYDATKVYTSGLLCF